MRRKITERKDKKEREKKITSKVLEGEDENDEEETEKQKAKAQYKNKISQGDRSDVSLNTVSEKTPTIKLRSRHSIRQVQAIDMRSSFLNYGHDHINMPMCNNYLKSLKSSNSNLSRKKIIFPVSVTLKFHQGYRNWYTNMKLNAVFIM